MDLRIHRNKPINRLWLLLPALLGIAASALLLAAAQHIPTVDPDASGTLTQRSTAFAAFRTKQMALPEEPASVSFIAVGDSMLSRDVASTYKRHGGPSWVFDTTRSYLQSADFVFANLETPVTAGSPVPTASMSFRSDPEVVPALHDANIAIVSLANNHVMNAGATGLVDTLRNLDDGGILHSGAGENLTAALAPAVIERNGIRIAFLAFNDTDVVPPSYGADETRPGTAFMNISRMTAAVQSAKAESDVVIVSMHSGKEYAPTPDASQTAFAQAAIDAGAALVIGHHPHVVQNVELYKGKYILYSLGNFIFDQMWSADTQRGMTVRIDLDKYGVARLDFQPVLIQNYGQPSLMSGGGADAVLARLKLSGTTGVEYAWNGTSMTERPHSSIGVERGDVRTKAYKTFSGDLNADGVVEQFVLRDGVVKVSDDNGKAIWQSDADWWIDDALLADADNNGIPDLVLSVWKSGNYGKDKPSWVTANDPAIRNHLFLFDLKGGKIQPIWQSSNLARPNCALGLTDLGDGKQSLLVLEGDYAEPGACSPKYLAVWHWQTWGFVNDWRSTSARFVGMRSSNETETIIADIATQ